MNLYEDLASRDVISQLRPLLDSGEYHVNPDTGKIVKTFMHQAHVSPWVFIRLSRWQMCQHWHRVCFATCGILPEPCLSCWKVVVRPQTLPELFSLYDLMRRLDLPSKCGTEQRESVCGLYGGYFYNHGFEEGLDTLDHVRAEVDEQIGDHVPVFLKRGCTEFEHQFGPSNRWEEQRTEAMAVMEQALNDALAPDVLRDLQPAYAIEAIMRSWIHHAYACGDETYKEFTGGEPLFPPYVVYTRDQPHGFGGA